MLRRRAAVLTALGWLAGACAARVENESPDGATVPKDAGAVTSPDAGPVPDGGALVPDAGMSSPDAGSGDGGFVHAPFPTLVAPSPPAQVLAHPTVVTVTFSDDPNAATLQAFDDWIVTSTWLSTVGADYGVGPGTNTNIPVSDTAASTFTGQSPQQYVREKILNGTLPFPESPPDGGRFGGTVYILYYPPGVSPLGRGEGGVHTCDTPYPLLSDAGTNPYYQLAMIASDPNLPSLEVAGSHELIEAATDPCTTQGYQIIGWNYLEGFEVGDLCLGFQLYTQDPATGYYLQRVWSASAASRSLDPCIPASAGTYFNVSPSPAAAVTLPAGTSQTFTLTGWADGPVGSWSLSTLSLGNFDPSPQLGATSIGVGQQVTVTLSVPAGTPSLSWGTAVIFSGPDKNYWPVTVIAQ